MFGCTGVLARVDSILRRERRRGVCSQTGREGGGGMSSRLNMLRYFEKTRNYVGSWESSRGSVLWSH